MKLNILEDFQVRMALLPYPGRIFKSSKRKVRPIQVIYISISSESSIDQRRLGKPKLLHFKFLTSQENISIRGIFPNSRRGTFVSVLFSSLIKKKDYCDYRNIFFLEFHSLLCIDEIRLLDIMDTFCLDVLKILKS